MLILVLGDIDFGIILSVSTGKNNRGIVSPIEPPSSVISKNESLVSEASSEAPMDPSNEISNVSAPLKIFLIFNPVLNAKPTV